MEAVALPRLLTWLQPYDFPRKLGICERLFGRRLSRHGICWVQTAAGLVWKLDLTNATDRWIVFGKYEGSAFLNWARKFLPPDGIVVDSGANIGQMLLYLAQWVPKGKVFAFEPGKAQADWLQECLQQYPHLPVELLRLGLGSRRGKALLKNCGPEDFHGGWNQISETDGEPVEIVRLADTLRERSVSQVNLWKLDVEGYEMQCLEGAEEMLRLKTIKAVYVELAGPNGARIREYLSVFGYGCHLFDTKGKLFGPVQLPEFTYGLFLPE